MARGVFTLALVLLWALRKLWERRCRRVLADGGGQPARAVVLSPEDCHALEVGRAMSALWRCHPHATVAVPVGSSRLVALSTFTVDNLKRVLALHQVRVVLTMKASAPQSADQKIVCSWKGACQKPPGRANEQSSVLHSRLICTLSGCTNANLF